MKYTILILFLSACDVNADDLPTTTTTEASERPSCPPGFYVGEGPSQGVFGCYQLMDGSADNGR